MSIQNIPALFSESKTDTLELFVYDFKMTNDVVKSKVNLGLHMFSFLQTGKKQVHFAGNSVAVNKSQSLLIKKGNSLWTELLEKDAIYYCKLLFFSDKKLEKFLKKHSTRKIIIQDEVSFFIIKNDNYISSYLSSLSIIANEKSNYKDNLLSLKFEELLLYLIHKYGNKFESYLHSLISKDTSSFTSIVEGNTYSNLKLEEIAFLCNMSLSTFKRHFINEYQTSPGKWLQDKRLQKAKELLQYNGLKVSDIYIDLGYTNLSNFSAAFKNKFGISPTEVQ